MKRVFCLCVGVTLLGGCASHSWRVDGDTLTLLLDRPGAAQVALASSLDGFAPRPAERTSNAWAVSVPAGTSFRYFYLVDNQVFLPDCRLREQDDFGAWNCVYEPEL